MIDHDRRRWPVRCRPSPTRRSGTPTGACCYEECFTRDGFDGPYTIALPPATGRTRCRGGRGAARAGRCRWPRRDGRARWPSATTARRSCRAAAGPPVDARRAAAVQPATSCCRSCSPTAADPVYFVNGDGDDLFYVFAGRRRCCARCWATCASTRATTSSCPRGSPTASCPTPIARSTGCRSSAWAACTCPAVAQRGRPAAHGRALQPPRLPRGPSFAGPRDEGIRDAGGQARRRASTASSTSTRRWTWSAGTARCTRGPSRSWRSSRGSAPVHLPPTWHGTFAARGALICSFVPRPLDFHPDAIPCPYPHASVDCDEFLFYCQRQLHLPPGRRPGQHLAPPRRRDARPPPGRLRGQHRRQADRRARRDAGHYAPCRPPPPPWASKIRTTSAASSGDACRHGSDAGGGGCAA